MEMNSSNFIKLLNQSSFTALFKIGTFSHLYNFQLYILKHCKCITELTFSQKTQVSMKYLSNKPGSLELSDTITSHMAGLHKNFY